MKESILKRSKFRALIAYLLLPVLLLHSCNLLPSTPSSDNEPAQGTLVVSAEASLQTVLVEIKDSFERKYPHVNVQFNFGASGALQKQIEQGVATDIFMPASNKQMNSLIKSGFVADDQQRDLLSNELVVIVNTTNKQTWSSLEKLTSAEMERIALGDPKSDSAGMYTEQTLQRLYFWSDIKDKAVFTKDVRQVLSYVDTGNVDAGFVYRTDALGAKNSKIVHFVNPKHHDPIIYPIGIIQQTRNAEAAQLWVEYVQQPEAQQIFKRYGFKMAGELNNA
ncbi:molybdate ABC transporter substrate-binding protein [Paenibacillus sp. SC116]|uniref:molybdate ABC transporter substrate-binding protein n=1 Tax=Paenibacillus sp. SC116 TaxID=2968986 RepID=UPI00215B5501|nr:molybdate ABC transporter substrate-binding protein [Paenibacillus sp. SC116]MCR8846536.1 molybdate ABC transporter substrate-binding protein [Paenibacillus sp. SC116]